MGLIKKYKLMLKNFFVVLFLCLSINAVEAIPTGNGSEFIPVNLGLGFFNPSQRLAVNGAALFSEKGTNPVPTLAGPGGLIYVDGSHLFFKSPLRTGSGFQLDFDSSDNTTFNNPTFTGNVTFNPLATVSGFNSVGTLNGNNLLAQNIINGATLVGDVVKVNSSLTAPTITVPVILSDTVFFNQNGGNLWGNNVTSSYRKYYKQQSVSAASSAVLTDADGAPFSRSKSYKLTAWTNGTSAPTGAVAYFIGDGLATGLPSFTLRKEYQEDVGDFDVKFFVNGTTGAPSLALFNATPGALATSKLVKLLVEETPHFGLTNYPFGVNQALSVTKLGNIGLGLESPSQKLEVVGTVKATAFNGDGAALKNISGLNVVGSIPGAVSPSSGTASGLIIRNAGTDLNGQVSVVAGEIILQDAFGLSKKVGPVNILLNMDSPVGLNARDSGVEAASTWYHIWIIANAAGNVAGVFSTSLVAPTLTAAPFSGYTYKAYVGSIFNDSASKFIRIYQSGKTVIRTPTTKTKEGLLAGSLASYSAASAISLANGVPLNAVAVYADAGISEMSYLWSIQGAHFKPTLASNIGETKLQNYYEATALYSDVKGESAWSIKMILIEPQKIYYECFNTRDFCTNNDTGGTHTRVLFRTTGWELP